MSFTVELLPPPSANNAFVNGRKGKGRFKSAVYKRWCLYACAAIKGHVPGKSRVAGKFYVAINLPRKMRGDIDNRVKGILDALVTSGRVDDDSHMDELHVCRRADQDFAVVIVRAADAGERIQALRRDPKALPHDPHHRGRPHQG